MASSRPDSSSADVARTLAFWDGQNELDAKPTKVVKPVRGEFSAKRQRSSPARIEPKRLSFWEGIYTPLPDIEAKSKAAAVVPVCFVEHVPHLLVAIEGKNCSVMTPFKSKKIDGETTMLTAVRAFNRDSCGVMDHISTTSFSKHLEWYSTRGKLCQFIVPVAKNEVHLDRFKAQGKVKQIVWLPCNDVEATAETYGAKLSYPLREFIANRGFIFRLLD